jgi:hypothetical protein
MSIKTLGVADLANTCAYNFKAVHGWLDALPHDFNHKMPYGAKQCFRESRRIDTNAQVSAV